MENNCVFHSEQLGKEESRFCFLLTLKRWLLPDGSQPLHVRHGQAAVIPHGCSGGQTTLSLYTLHKHSVISRTSEK